MKHIIYTLLFGVAVFLFFGLAYPHHLHYQEQYQLFLFDSSYVWEIVRLPGGVADLLGRFCTQFFLFAWVGAAIIAVLLSAVQLLTLRLFNGQWSMINGQSSIVNGQSSIVNGQWSMINGQWFYGLSFVPAFLLWLFLLDENALLGGVWAVLLTLLATWGLDKLSDGWVRRILPIAAAPILYWMAGPVCVVLIVGEASKLCNFLMGATGSKTQSLEASPTTGLLQSLEASPTIWCGGVVVLLVGLIVILSSYIPVPTDKLWTGVHYHRYPTVFPALLWYAVLSVFVLTLIAHVFKKWGKVSNHYAVSLCSFALVAAIMGSVVWKNSNFKAEKVMQYDFMARHQQWNRILQTINAEKPNNQIGVTVQNLALGMHGLLADHLFEFNQNGILGLLPDVERDATSPLPTAEVFYQLGMIYVAQRTVFEAQEAILDFQKSGRCYKRLAQTNLIIGSYEVARKYLTTLQKTLFYREWADETLQLLGNEEAIAKHPEYGRLRQFAYNNNFYFSDHVTPDMLESLFFSNMENRLAFEYLKAYYMLTGDRERYTRLLLHIKQQ